MQPKQQNMISPSIHQWAQTAIQSISFQVQQSQAELHGIVPLLTQLQMQSQTDPNDEKLKYELEQVCNRYEMQYRQYVLYVQQIQQLHMFQQKQIAIDAQREALDMQAMSELLHQQYCDREILEKQFENHENNITTVTESNSSSNSSKNS